MLRNLLQVLLCYLAIGAVYAADTGSQPAVPPDRAGPGTIIFVIVVFVVACVWFAIGVWQAEKKRKAEEQSKS